MYRVNPNALWKEATRVAAAAREVRALRALCVLRGVVLEARGASARRNPALSRRRSDIVGRADGDWTCSSRKSRLGEADSQPYDADPLECPVLARSATSAKARFSGARQAATDRKHRWQSALRHASQLAIVAGQRPSLDFRIGTLSGSKRRLEAVVRTDSGSGRSTLQITGLRKRAMPAI